MLLAECTGVSKRYGPIELLEGVDLQIRPGDRIGLIGRNGSGKTTFMRILAGEEQADEGSVEVSRRARIRYVPQQPRLSPELTVLEQIFQSDAPQVRLLLDYDMAAAQLQKNPDDEALADRLHRLSAEMDRTGSWSAEAEARSILDRLGLQDVTARVGSLSGGQRKRVALAQALIDNADLLILDEPTNHVDAEAVVWLEEYLHTRPTALMMVTHDRYFLDRIVNRIIELEHRALTTYEGNYSWYLKEREHRRQLARRKEETRQNLLRTELDWLSRSPKARTSKDKTRIERVQSMLKDRPPTPHDKVTIAIAGRRLGRQVLSATGLSKRFDEQTVFSGVDFTLNPGDRIGIVGKNGIGKSTLLNILAGQMEPDEGTVEWGQTTHLGYYDQESSGLPNDLTVLDYIETVAPNIVAEDGRIIDAPRMLEWFLFPRSRQRDRIAVLSGGERRRLYLLGILAQRPNVLFLDEPTNDLDIQTLTVLESFLDRFAGSLVVVSHDRWFMDRTVDYLVTFEHGSLSGRYPGPFESYVKLREAGQPHPDLKKPETPAVNNTRKTTPSGRLTRREEQQLEKLESSIADLEVQISRIDAEMADAAADYDRLQKLSENKQEVENQLESAMDAWAELSERAET